MYFKLFEKQSKANRYINRLPQHMLSFHIKPFFIFAIEIDVMIRIALSHVSIIKLRFLMNFRAPK